VTLIDVAPRYVGTPKRRSRGKKRREEIARVAQAVFLERGFTETTMQIIASCAGASKETLYRHFASKERLFAEIVNMRSALVFSQALDAFATEEQLESVLRQIGYNLLKLLIGADSVSICRVVIAETPRMPELGQLFFEQGPAQITKKLTNYLSTATEQGHLNCTDPALAAKLLLGAIVGSECLISLILPGPETMNEEEVVRHVEEAVAMFLARFGVGHSI
jgi:TetR/AcrR family transcriptional regulator, mexJK operon transcriptional repressor